MAVRRITLAYPYSLRTVSLSCCADTVYSKLLRLLAVVVVVVTNATCKCWGLVRIAATWRCGISGIIIIASGRSSSSRHYSSSERRNNSSDQCRVAAALAMLRRPAAAAVTKRRT